ncbi:helix-turn-helix domain-containing protein [Paenibacillus sp. Soil750]|uniref:helix-turn-helix domain-containing protein n=1 Tax=Paenibacillus sp. Soil750 TaxID=1736398 RepID=UPI000700990C|nr:helix-turn-helix transcriptional regulator [Paenibacillus sp. Soil750]KRE73928.1 hypothetical protein ASL11_06310 [Paenibacillus sp. Soil750]
MNTIGSKIKQIRKVNNMTQNEFSKLIGISQGTLSEIEKGKAKPTIETLQEINNCFQIDLNWLILENHGDIELFASEIELINKVRALDHMLQREILEFIDFKLTLIKSSKVKEI